MKKLILATLLTGALALPAFADTKPSDEEAAKIKAAIETYGFTGGTYEKEDEGSGVYEIDDAKNKDGGQFDVKLDKEFKLLSVTRD